jgi:LPPG:FO 2-phospho-L-lactate transferase
MLASLGFEVSPVGVARYYQGIISDFVIDQEDEDLASEVEALGLRVTVTNTWMSSAERRAELARVVLDAVA